MTPQENTAPAGTDQKPAPIVDAGKLAPVTASGITNKNLIAKDEDVTRFCKLVVAGLPTAKVFPEKLSAMEFTEEQRKQITVARKGHRRIIKANKSKVIGFLKSKAILFTGHKTNASKDKGRVSYVHESIFKKKTALATANAQASFFGEEARKQVATAAAKEKAPTKPKVAKTVATPSAPAPTATA